MELKNKTKFLLVFGIIFVAFLLFNTNNVHAANNETIKNTTNGESIQNGKDKTYTFARRQCIGCSDIRAGVVVSVLCQNY